MNRMVENEGLIPFPLFATIPISMRDETPTASPKSKHVNMTNDQWMNKMCAMICGGCLFLSGIFIIGLCLIIISVYDILNDEHILSSNMGGSIALLLFGVTMATPTGFCVYHMVAYFNPYNKSTIHPKSDMPQDQWRWL